MRPKIFLSLLLMLFSFLQTMAQQRTVTGTVTNSKDGSPLADASVIVVGEAKGTTTNSVGTFSINVSSNAKQLRISHVGLETKTIAIPASSVVSVSLATVTENLQDVVVVGYISQKKPSITGAVSTVNMGDLSKTRIADVSQALQGQVAGVFVAANTGAPGDGIIIRIRGEGTLGNNDALYVVDGVPTRDISFLNQSDVKSITVLKDAAATAIYGSRAASGVVVITTNSGVRRKTNITVEYNSGFYNATNMPKMLDATQYLTVKDMAWHNTAGNSSGAV